MRDVTRILSAIEQGDLQATEQLLPLVYQALRKPRRFEQSHSLVSSGLYPYEGCVATGLGDQWLGLPERDALALEITMPDSALLDAI